MRKINFLFLCGALLLTTACAYAGRIGVCGTNTYGQFGNGTTSTTTTGFDAVTIIGTDTDWVNIASGVYHSLALKTNGTLWAWGRNDKGQLGDGTTTDKYVPTQVGTDTLWKQFDGGLAFTIAIKTDGTLWAWGENTYGQLGNGTNTDQTSPVQIGTATDWKQVDCAESSVIALKTDGTLWAWGRNNNGQLGDGTTTNKSVPTQIGSANDWWKISAGKYTAMAIKTDSTLWSWGLNDFYTAPYDTYIATPTQYGTNTDWKLISVGQNTTNALTYSFNGFVALENSHPYNQIYKVGFMYWYAAARKYYATAETKQINSNFYNYGSFYNSGATVEQISAYLTEGRLPLFRCQYFVTGSDGTLWKFQDQSQNSQLSYLIDSTYFWGKVNCGGEHLLVLEKTPQNISFGAIPDKSIGDIDFTVTATTDSKIDEPIVFTSSDTNVAKCTGTNGATIQITCAGTCTITAIQAGNDCYRADTATQTLKVKNKPLITWSTPADITYGTVLSSTQLNATADIDGTFSYTPASETALSAGDNQKLLVQFTPTDATNYITVKDSVYINVKKSAPVITWNNPANITYGTALGTTQLNATADISGTFEYNPAKDSVLNAGIHKLATIFTPADAANYNVVNDTVSITVKKAIPIITWSNPADITYGTVLSSEQLNATANVAGTFEYNPTAGSVLNVGDNQELAVTFTPTHTENYETANETVFINVKSGMSTAIPYETTNESISISPNPVNNQFHISGLMDESKIAIIDLMGNQILKTYVSPTSLIFIDNLPTGIYLLNIETEKGATRLKLIKK